MPPAERHVARDLRHRAGRAQPDAARATPIRTTGRTRRPRTERHRVIDLAVTNESFFPMASPHTLRSEVLINDDPTAGTQIPRLQGAPVVAVNGIILPQLGTGSENTPLLDVRFATEDPHVAHRSGLGGHVRRRAPGLRRSVGHPHDGRQLPVAHRQAAGRALLREGRRGLGARQSNARPRSRARSPSGTSRCRRAPSA